MSDPVSKLLEIQNDYEQRFNCLICFSPKTRMIYGSCQHKVCQDCLYTDEGLRRSGMQKCPYCQKYDAFPQNRPDVPEDNIDQQKFLGMCKCPHSGCDLELWLWEIEAHQQECPGLHTQKSGKMLPRRSRCSESDTGPTRNTRQKREDRNAELGPIIPQHLSRRNQIRPRARSNSVYTSRSTQSR